MLNLRVIRGIFLLCEVFIPQLIVLLSDFHTWLAMLSKLEKPMFWVALDFKFSGNELVEDPWIKQLN